MYSLLTTTVHQQIAADRRHRFLDVAARTRRRRTPVAPDLIRTADLGVLPTASPPGGGTAVRVGSGVAA